MTEGYQSQGQWGARDFDKVIFNLPIPLFDDKLQLHRRLAEAASDAERLAADVPLEVGIYFTTARRKVRNALSEAGITQKIDGLVAELLKLPTRA